MIDEKKIRLIRNITVATKIVGNRNEIVLIESTKSCRYAFSYKESFHCRKGFSKLCDQCLNYYYKNKEKKNGK